MNKRNSLMNAQFITTASGERMAVIAENDYRRLIDSLEDALDGTVVASFHEKLASGQEELIPAEFANRLIDGENPIKVWREYRKMTSRDLAAKADISPGFLSQIETGVRDGSFETIKKIAVALNVTLDDLA